MLIILLLYVPKKVFSDVNVGKLEESSRTMLPFLRVCLWRHNHFTWETGRVACHTTPCGRQAGHFGQIVWKTLWIWEKWWYSPIKTFPSPTGVAEKKTTTTEVQGMEWGICRVNDIRWHVSRILKTVVVIIYGQRLCNDKQRMNICLNL